jgi:hypothetical protein
MDAVGFALAGLILAAAIQWLVEAKHHADESAWDRVEAMWGYPFLGLVALTIVFLLGHFFRARYEVFVAHRDCADKAEAKLVEANVEIAYLKDRRAGGRGALKSSEVWRTGHAEKRFASDARNTTTSAQPKQREG